MNQSDRAPALDVLGTPYPPDIGQDKEKQRRWNLASQAAHDVSSALEPSGEPDRTWVWMATRSLYSASIPTG